MTHPPLLHGGSAMEGDAGVIATGAAAWRPGQEVS